MYGNVDRCRGSANGSRIRQGTSGYLESCRISLVSAGYPNIAPSEIKSGANFIFMTDSSIIACGDTNQFSITMSYTGGSNTGSFTINIPSSNCTPCGATVADLVFSRYTLASDTCAIFPANNDGAIEPGETVAMSIMLVNNGPDNAAVISAVLSSTTAGVSITQNTSAFPDIQAGLSGTGITDYAFTSEPAIVTCGMTLQFRLNITYSGGSATDTFSIPIPTPSCIACTEIAATITPLLADQCPSGGAGNANAAIDPGETIELWFTVRNDSSLLYHSVRGTLSSSAPGITITKDTASFGDILMLNSVDNGSDRFKFGVDAATFACGNSFDVALLLTGPEGFKIEPTTFTIPTPCTECQAAGCALGTPDHIGDLKIVRTGTDLERVWTQDVKAQGGWDIYMTDDKLSLANQHDPSCRISTRTFSRTSTPPGSPTMATAKSGWDNLSLEAKWGHVHVFHATLDPKLELRRKQVNCPHFRTVSPDFAVALGHQRFEVLPGPRRVHRRDEPGSELIRFRSGRRASRRPGFPPRRASPAKASLRRREFR